ncbi:alpha/beta fold hydrolase [Chloroflexota bacterium]
MKRAYVDTPDGQIHYRIEGSGEPLLLVHNATISSDEFTDMLPFLGDKCQAIAVDLPGYGMSDKLLHKYSIEDYARNLISFMDTLDIKKASFVGIGSGGSIAVEVAVNHPERVDKIVISGCPYYTLERREERIKDPRFFPPPIKEDGSHLMNRWDYLTAYNRQSKDPRSRPEHWYRNYVNYMLGGEGAEDAHQAVFRYKIEKRLPLLKQPVLLISGPEDVFYNVLEVVKSLIPRCKTLVINGGGIGGFLIEWEQPKEFSQVILDFMANTEV